jgi:hypothetical protein
MGAFVQAVPLPEFREADPVGRLLVFQGEEFMRITWSNCRTLELLAKRVWEVAMSAGAAAAAARARRQRQEEEEMTPYTRQDLSENWGFKIIRSSTGAFKYPVTMRAVLEEEGRAGWVLVEKFDNGRMRLKRPHDARSADAGLGFDPYRTHVGVSEGALVAIIIASVVGGLGKAIASKPRAYCSAGG